MRGNDFNEGRLALRVAYACAISYQAPWPGQPLPHLRYALKQQSFKMRQQMDDLEVMHKKMAKHLLFLSHIGKAGLSSDALEALVPGGSVHGTISANALSV